MLSYIHMSLEKTYCIFLNNCLSSDTYTGFVSLYVSWMENRYLALPRYQLVITDVYSSLLILIIDEYSSLLISTHYRCILVIADINSSLVITDINSSLSQYELVISDIYSSFTNIYSSLPISTRHVPISTRHLPISIRHLPISIRHCRYLLVITDIYSSLPLDPWRGRCISLSGPLLSL